MSTLPAAAAAARPHDSISPVLERVLAHNATVVQHVARRHGLSDSDVDELLQDVRIRLWRALSTGEKISRAPASYVYRTALSAALDLIRRRRARREENLDWQLGGRLFADDSRPDQSVELAELATQLARALASLNRTRRVVVRMHLAGYHRLEIAKILGWSDAKTRNLLYRGLADLRSRLDQQHLESD